MNATKPSLLTRDDTFFGVCEGLGEDLGINANLLRIAFAVSLLFNPVAVIVTYAALGLILAAARWAFPARTAAPDVAAPAAAAPEAGNDRHEIEFRKAA